MLKFLRLGIVCFLTMPVAPALADQYSQEIKIYRSKAVESQFLGNPEAALDNYQQALRIASGVYGANSPFLAEIYYDMGALCLSNSNFNKAEEYLNQTIRLNPNSSAAHLRLAELMRIKGRADEAQKHARTVVSKHRDDLVARQELAMAYERNEPSDNIRAYREYSAMEQLIRNERERYQGKTPPPFSLPSLSLPVFNQTPKTQSDTPEKKEAKPEPKKQSAQDKKLAAEAKKKADQEKAKSASEAKKKAEQEKKAAALESKKMADLLKKAELEAKKKANQEKAKAAAAEAKKKAPKPTPKVVPETETMSGLPAKLKGQAVLLTPVKKKPAATESSTLIMLEPKKAPKPAAKTPEAEADPGNEDSDNSQEIIPKKIPVKPVKKVEPQVLKPKPGKHAPGLVPPPPPVMTYPTMQMMPLPQTVAPKPAAKAAPAPKKEEKPKEQAPVKDDGKGGADEDDFLLDWGGAKNKKK